VDFDLATTWAILTCIVVILVGATATWYLGRRVDKMHARAASGDLPAPVATPRDETGVIVGLSERIAALEGRLPTLQVAIDNYRALAERVTGLEAQLPAIADAHEAFTDAFSRKTKRDGERERKAGISAGDAAAEMLQLSALPQAVGGPPGGSNDSPALPLYGNGRRKRKAQ